MHFKCNAFYRYRGRVISTDPLKVHFVDWGNVEEFNSTDDVKVLPETFCKDLPMVSFFNYVEQKLYFS